MSDNHDHGMPVGASLALITYAGFQFASNHQLHNGLVSTDAWHNLVDGLVPLLGILVPFAMLRYNWHWIRHNLDGGVAIVIYVLMMTLVVLTVRQPGHFHRLLDVVRIEGGSAALNLAIAAWVIYDRRRHYSRVSRALAIHLIIDVAISGSAALGAYWAYHIHDLGVMGPIKLVLVVMVAAVAAYEIHEMRYHIHRKINCDAP